MTNGWDTLEELYQMDDIDYWKELTNKLDAENTHLREINEAQAMDAWAHEVYLEKIAGLEAELERLRAALRPFVEIWRNWCENPDTLQRTISDSLFRRAADALETEAQP